MRFKLLDKAVKIISLTTTLQEFQEETREMTVKRFGQKCLFVRSQSLGLTGAEAQQAKKV